MTTIEENIKKLRSPHPSDFKAYELLLDVLEDLASGLSVAQSRILSLEMHSSARHFERCDVVFDLPKNGGLYQCKWEKGHEGNHGWS